MYFDYERVDSTPISVVALNINELSFTDRSVCGMRTFMVIS